MTIHPGPFLMVRTDHHDGPMAGRTRVHIDPWPGPEQTAAELRATWRKRAETNQWSNWRITSDGALTHDIHHVIDNITHHARDTYTFHDTDPRDQGVLW